MQILEMQVTESCKIMLFWNHTMNLESFDESFPTKSCKIFKISRKCEQLNLAKPWNACKPVLQDFEIQDASILALKVFFNANSRKMQTIESSKYFEILKKCKQSSIVKPEIQAINFSKTMNLRKKIQALEYFKNLENPNQKNSKFLQFGLAKNLWNSSSQILQESYNSETKLQALDAWMILKELEVLKEKCKHPNFARPWKSRQVFGLARPCNSEIMPSNFAKLTKSCKIFDMLRKFEQQKGLEIQTI